jgi:hypothetical protein
MDIETEEGDEVDDDIMLRHKRTIKRMTLRRKRIMTKLLCRK